MFIISILIGHCFDCYWLFVNIAITSAIQGKPLAMYICLQQCSVPGWPNGKMEET